jgi:hypothetical protein
VTEKLLFEGLARYAHIPQGAAQLEALLRADPFFTRHGANVPGYRPTRRISRTTVKVHVQRLRVAMAMAFAEAGVNIDPVQVLRTERAAGPLGYRLWANVEWRHLNE